MIPCENRKNKYIVDIAIAKCFNSEHNNSELFLAHELLDYIYIYI